MDKAQLISKMNEFVDYNEDNFIKERDAISTELVNKRLFEQPLVGFASACDSIFQTYKESYVIGNNFLLPTEFFGNAKTVISVFFPFTEEIVLSNSEKMDLPSSLWLHGRIEGQNFIDNFLVHIVDFLSENGFDTIAPTLDERWLAEKSSTEDNFLMNSTWSDRHCAFACGLGTFGLSKGIITEKGMAGRLCSFITSACFEPTERKYTDTYEYCVLCGKCARNCPANAISKEKGKNNIMCETFVAGTKKAFNPRYGCGKCQVSVPCSRKSPKKIKNS